MKNNWVVYEDDSFIEYTFLLEREKYDDQIIIELITNIAEIGEKYRVFRILDKEMRCAVNSFLQDLELKFLSVDHVDNGVRFGDVLSPLSPEFCDITQTSRAFCELAFYNNDGDLLIQNVFHLKELYQYFNADQLKHCHFDNTGVYAPLNVEMIISSDGKLQLRIASALNIWHPFFKPDSYRIGDAAAGIVPVNDMGYYDNRELYFLNTPRLKGFIKEVKAIFEQKNCIISIKGPLDQEPCFDQFIKSFS